MLRSSLLIVLVAACHTNDTTVDAAIHDAPHASPDAPPDALAGRHGQIAIVKRTTPLASTGQVSATLSDAPIFGAVVATDGPCTLYHHVSGGRLSGGVITVMGTTPTFTMTPGGTSPSIHYATSPTPTATPYTAGATISIAAAGDEFPAFSGSLTAPTALAGFTAPTTVSRAGYTATWTAGAGPKIWVIIDVPSLDTLICRVDDTGSFTVPASSFALFPANTQCGVALARVSEQTVAPDVLLLVVSTIASSLIPLTP